MAQTEKKGLLIDFDVVQLGKGGKQFEVIPRTDYGGSQPNQEFAIPSTSPYKLPTQKFDSSVTNQLDLDNNINSYITPEVHSRWERSLDISSICFSMEQSSTEEVLGKSHSLHSNPLQSTSILRKPGKKENFVFGSSKNVPFLPGGFEKQQSKDTRTSIKFEPKELEFDSIPLKSCPPGFSNGLEFKGLSFS